MKQETGTAAIALAAVSGVLAAVLVAVASVGLALSAKTQASTAADAAALAAAVATYPSAGARGPVEAASSAARSNGARVVSCRCPVDLSINARVAVVTVAMPVDLPVFGRVSVRAVAAAEFDPREWLGR